MLSLERRYLFVGVTLGGLEGVAARDEVLDLGLHLGDVESGHGELLLHLTAAVRRQLPVRGQRSVRSGQVRGHRSRPAPAEGQRSTLLSAAC